MELPSLPLPRQIPGFRLLCRRRSLLPMHTVRPRQFSSVRGFFDLCCWRRLAVKFFFFGGELLRVGGGGSGPCGGCVMSYWDGVCARDAPLRTSTFVFLQYF